VLLHTANRNTLVLLHYEATRPLASSHRQGRCLLKYFDIIADIDELANRKSLSPASDNNTAVEYVPHEHTLNITVAILQAYRILGNLYHVLNDFTVIEHINYFQSNNI
jgi:hypothetical protein